MNHNANGYASLHLAHRYFVELSGEPFVSFMTSAPGAICYSLRGDKFKQLSQRMRDAGYADVTERFVARNTRPFIVFALPGEGRYLRIEDLLTKCLLYLIDEEIYLADKRDDKMGPVRSNNA